MSTGRLPVWRKILRWALVLPGAGICAILALFPIHWVVLAIQYFGTESDPVTSFVNYSNPFAALPPQVLEYFANAFLMPFIVIGVGARIAPRFKFQTGIALAILLGVIYGVLSQYVVADIQNGLYTTARWIRLGISVGLCVAGVGFGLLQAFKVSQSAES